MVGFFYPKNISTTIVYQFKFWIYHLGYSLSPPEREMKSISTVDFFLCINIHPPSHANIPYLTVHLCWIRPPLPTCGVSRTFAMAPQMTLTVCKISKHPRVRNPSWEPTGTSAPNSSFSFHSAAHTPPLPNSSFSIPSTSHRRFHLLSTPIWFPSSSFECLQLVGSRLGGAEVP